MKRASIVVALVSGVLGCGGGDGSLSDHVGVYEVTHHTVNEAACAAEGDVNTEYTHFQLLLDDLFGQKFLSFGECESADPSTCDDAGFFNAYIETNGELLREVSSSSGGGDLTCYLGYARGVLTSPSDGVVHIELKRYGDEDDTLTADECDPDLASERGDSMPCEEYEVIEGVLVE